MPRDAGGIYFLPTGNPVVSGTVIESDWANPTMSDLGGEVSDSLSRSGKGGMLAALRGLDGSAAQPTFSFTNEPSTGRFRAGPGQVVEAVAGVPVVRYLSSGLEQWDPSLNGGAGGWVPLTPRDALGTPFDPGPSNLTTTNVQDAIEEVNGKTGGLINADAVLYDDTAVYFPASTVQQAIDRLGIDVSGLANDILDNADAIDIIGGDLILLEVRVGLNETNIGSNTNAILLLDSIVQGNTAQININSGDISTIKLEQIEQDSRITSAEEWTQFNWGRIQTNEANIASNDTDIATNAAGISTNSSNITANASNIATNASNINTNASNITTNASGISTNKALSESNRNDIDFIAGTWFGGVATLQTIYGGTGVTTQTGTGATVHQSSPQINSPAIAGGTLDTNVRAITQTSTDNSTRIATTAHVKQVTANMGDTIFTSASNANGTFFAVRGASSGDWHVVMWGRATLVTSPGTTVYFPTTWVNNVVYDITISPYAAGIEGLDVAPGVNSRFNDRWVGIHINALNGWCATGTIAVSLAAYVESGDRYFNKVTLTEHVQALHGPWDADPNVVILPPGNVFWGPPLDGDEVLTFDGGGLPLARVPRIVPQAETLGLLLRSQNLTQSTLERALYLDQRGIGTPLVDFNAAIDALVLSEAVTLETLVELI